MTTTPMTPGDAAPHPLSPWHTPRGKFLAALAGLTALVVVAAGLALTGERARTATRFEPQLLFPAFGDKAGSAAAVTLTSPDGAIALALGADKKWHATSLHDYPASGERVRLLLLGVSGLTAIEQKTAQASLHNALQLGDPKAGGGGTLITVADNQGQSLAALVTGKGAPGAAEGEDRFYARRMGEDQTYVVRGAVPRSVAPADWLETAIVDVPRARVRAVHVTPLQGPAYTISRAKADDANFVLENVPKGRVILNDTVANPTGAALVGLTLDDVRKDGEIDFAKAARAVFETFDGLTVTVDTAADKSGAFWLRVKADGTGDAKAEADAINARVSGWVYKVSEWKGEVLQRTQERLLQSLVPNAPKVEGGAP